MDLVAIWPDTHAPYHHQKTCGLALGVLEYLKPKQIIFLGDLLDMYAVNGHGRHSKARHTILEEIEGAKRFLRLFDEKLPDAEKIFIQGNHEYRLERYIHEKAPELFGVTDIEYLLELDKNPMWKIIRYTSRQSYQILNSKLYARHEPLGPNAKASASRALRSVVYGHIHRIEEAYVVGVDGRSHVNWSPGWLGDERKEDIYGYCKNKQWSLGFGLVWINPSNGFFYHQIVPIMQDMSCVVNGKLFKL